MDGEINVSGMSITERMSTYTLNISEIFYSIEGEGIRIGEPTIYVRVIGCPHRCSWCDTPYSIGKTRTPIENYNMKLIDIYKKIKDIINEHNLTDEVWVEFTGGEPMWFPNEVGTLMDYIKRNIYAETGCSIGIVLQTSGGWYQTEPKALYYSNRDLMMMSDLVAADWKDEEENIPFVFPLRLMRRQDEIKFLIKDDRSYNYVKNTIKYLLKEEVPSKFIITTVTNNQDDVTPDHVVKLKTLTEKILNDPTFPKNQVKILVREHILLWGNKRGV